VHLHLEIILYLGYKFPKLKALNEQGGKTSLLSWRIHGVLCRRTMSTLTINLEIGHDAYLREKITPEGYTHDWEVFVRGCNGADIRHYVDRVVFHLHETFEKPKRGK